MLDSIDGISLENVHGVSLDYLNECMSDLESKDSGIRLSPGSPGTFGADGKLDKFTERDLASLDMELLKDTDLSLKGECHLDNNVNEIPRLVNEASKTRENSVLIQNEESSLGNLHQDENGTDHFLYVQKTQSKACEIFGKFEPVEERNLALNLDNDRCKETSSRELNRDRDNVDRVERRNRQSSSDYSTDKESEVDKSSDGEEPGYNEIKKANSDSSDGKNKPESLPQACEQCPMTFKYKRHLDRHLEGHQKNNCPHCDAKFARKKHLDVHLFRLHGERITKYPHTCDVCLRGFPKRLLLNRHKANHHYEKGKMCTDCGDILENSSEIREHSEKHSQEKRFQCNKCPQAFSMEQKYLVHVKNHDTYKCPRCEATFASKKTANEHYRVKHSAKQPKEPETSITGIKNNCFDNIIIIFFIHLSVKLIKIL